MSTVSGSTVKLELSTKSAAALPGLRAQLGRSLYRSDIQVFKHYCDTVSSRDDDTSVIATIVHSQGKLRKVRLKGMGGIL